MRVSHAVTGVLCLVPVLRAQTVPDGFVVDTLVSSGLQSPTDCAFLPDGRVLITNAPGDVTVFANGASATVGTVPNVEFAGERGLLSIAVDPAFSTNGYVYAYSSSLVDSFLHVDRFTCSGSLTDPNSTNLQFSGSSRRVVLDDLPDDAGNHNGGALRFGPDGMLYLTVGDDGVSCDAQSTTSRVGCLLRMDVGGLPAGGSATGPSWSSLDPGDNPMSANTDFSQLVIAHGLRNPFRMEIDPVTGNLYIGDVGAGSEEEYSEYVYPATGSLPLVNFGWPWREGSAAASGCSGGAPSGMTEPLVSVSHVQDWFSVMGGARYRNRGAPWDFGAAYEGSAFYLDYFSGEVRRLVNSGSWVAAPPVPGQPSAENWGVGFTTVTSLRLGIDGSLWLTQQDDGGSGALKRIRAQPTTHFTFADACYAPFDIQVAGSGVVGGSIVSSVTQPMPWICMYGLTRQSVSLSVVWPACQCLVGHDLVVLEMMAPGTGDQLFLDPAWGPAGYSIFIQGCGLQHPAGGPCPDLQVITTDTVRVTTS